MNSSCNLLLILSLDFNLENMNIKGEIFTAFRIRAMEVHPGPLAKPLRNHQKLRRNTESNPAIWLVKITTDIYRNKATNRDFRIGVKN